MFLKMGKDEIDYINDFNADVYNHHLLRDKEIIKKSKLENHFLTL